MGNLKIRVPRGGLAESGILEMAFWGLQAFQRLSKEINHVLLIGVATMITWSIVKAHQIHWGWQWPSGVNIKGAVYSHGYGDGRLCPLMVWLNKFPVFWYYFTCLMSYLLFLQASSFLPMAQRMVSPESSNRYIQQHSGKSTCPISHCIQLLM